MNEHEQISNNVTKKWIKENRSMTKPLRYKNEILKQAKEIKVISSKMEKLRLTYNPLDCTRSRITTLNSNLGKLNDRRLFLIANLKNTLKKSDILCESCKKENAKNLACNYDLLCDTCLTACSDF